MGVAKAERGFCLDCLYTLSAQIDSPGRQVQGQDQKGSDKYITELNLEAERGICIAYCGRWDYDEDLTFISVSRSRVRGGIEKPNGTRLHSSHKGVQYDALEKLIFRRVCHKGLRGEAKEDLGIVKNWSRL